MIHLDFQFEKKPIAYLRTVMRQVQTQEQTQEVRLPEEMPDIGDVLASWGQVLLRGKEWRSGGMHVSGGVMMWVLYAPEDGSQPRCVEAWLPFQLKWEFPTQEQDGVIMAYPLLRSVDARSTAARKIMARASVSVLAEAMCPGETVVYEPVDLPKDIHILKNRYPMCVPAESGEKAFSMEETLHLPDAMATPARILRYELRPEATEERLLADKLIFRGTAVVHVLFADSDGNLHSWMTDVPFSQYAELNREYADEGKASVCMAVTNLELELDPTGALVLKAGLTGQYTIFDCMDVQLVEDAYSPMRPVQIQNTQLQLPAVLESMTQTYTPEVSVENSEDQIVDVAFYPEHGRAYYEDGQMVAEMSGNFQLLCKDPEGRLHGQQSRWEDRWTMPASGNVKADTVLTPVGKYENYGTGAGARLRLDMQTVAQAGMLMVTGLEFGEMEEPNPDRPSLILCKIGQESLWDVAKRTGSTVESIMQINGLQQEPEADRMLLVPVL